MRIAIVSPGLLPVPAEKGGAVETLIETFANKATEDKYKDINIDIFSVNDAITEEKNITSSNIVYNQIPKREKKNDYITKFLRRIKREIDYDYYLRHIGEYIKKNEYDAIIVENQAMFVKYISGISKNSIYLHMHNEIYPKSRLYYKEIIDNCKKIICVSEYIKSSISSYFKCSNSVVLHNGIDVDRFKRQMNPEAADKIKEKYGIDKNSILICYAGRFVPNKGVKEAVESFVMLNDIPNLTLVVIGSTWFGDNSNSKYIDDVKKIAQMCKNKVVFTGYIDNSEVAAVESICDIAVIPSLWNDPLPLSVIEAMSSGLVVITTRVGGMPEMCNSETGFVLEVDEMLSQNIANTIRTVIHDQTLKNEISCKAREKVENEFSTDNYYRNFISIIEECDS